jgi:hypothetical protein
MRSESLFRLWRPILIPLNSLIVTNKARNHSGHRTEVGLRAGVASNTDGRVSRGPKNYILPIINPILRFTVYVEAVPMHNNDDPVRSNPGDEVPNLSVPGPSPSSCPYRMYNHYCKVGNNRQPRLPIHSQPERSY